MNNFHSNDIVHIKDCAECIRWKVYPAIGWAALLAVLWVILQVLKWRLARMKGGRK